MATHAKGSAAEVRALDAYIKLVRAGDTLGARVREIVAGYGLTETQFAVLEALYHLGPLHANQLAKKLLRSGANITTVLDNLEKTEQIERVRGGEDRRCVTIRLTAAGTTLIRTVFPAVASKLTGLMSALDPREQDELGKLARKLGRSASTE